MFDGKNDRRGLLIKNCRSVHTGIMNYDIDVICLDRDYQCGQNFTALKPFRFIFPQKSTAHILEILLIKIFEQLLKPETISNTACGRIKLTRSILSMCLSINFISSLYVKGFTLSPSNSLSDDFFYFNQAGMRFLYFVFAVFKLRMLRVYIQ
jgi:hypothetical protein